MRITRRYWNGKSDFDVCADDPVAIGEVKKFDEGGSLRRIEEDKRKMCFVARLMRITGFLGVYVTDTRLSYTARLAQINAMLHSSPWTAHTAAVTARGSGFLRYGGSGRKITT